MSSVHGKTVMPDIGQDQVDRIRRDQESGVSPFQAWLTHTGATVPEFARFLEQFLEQATEFLGLQGSQRLKRLCTMWLGRAGCDAGAVESAPVERVLTLCDPEGWRSARVEEVEALSHFTGQDAESLFLRRHEILPDGPLEAIIRMAEAQPGRMGANLNAVHRLQQQKVLAEKKQGELRRTRPLPSFFAAVTESSSENCADFDPKNITIPALGQWSPETAGSSPRLIRELMEYADEKMHSVLKLRLAKHEKQGTIEHKQKRAGKEAGELLKIARCILDPKYINKDDKALLKDLGEFFHRHIDYAKTDSLNAFWIYSPETMPYEPLFRKRLQTRSPIGYPDDRAGRSAQHMAENFFTHYKYYRKACREIYAHQKAHKDYEAFMKWRCDPASREGGQCRVTLISLANLRHSRVHGPMQQLPAPAGQKRRTP